MTHSRGDRWLALALAQAHVHARIERDLHRRHHIVFSEFTALKALSSAELQELRIQELAEATALNQSSISRLVGRLDRLGLTERRKCEFDKRGVYIGLSPAGAELLATATKTFETVLNTALETIPDAGSREAICMLLDSSLVR
ncbi:MarR family winged helix-turn-helix transcriptional regulator [Nocardia sp. alder85J]|uniref:MarR family winged helix-turn-helix transcriptional regulator n=1 Tax=Nocardia sp. alder85J TaxID=2862949 RepID=UPI001CD63623|nr:MarR family transcriptional regulator [Nocardia sp. alder85J]MCX4096685.1 MarR family transcriptional regulator [Nocardia sp. alder85J]